MGTMIRIAAGRKELSKNVTCHPCRLHCGVPAAEVFDITFLPPHRQVVSLVDTDSIEIDRIDIDGPAHAAWLALALDPR